MTPLLAIQLLPGEGRKRPCARRQCRGARGVTRRKQSEEDALFILDLNECIRLAAESEELPWAVAVALGEYGAVDRCAFVEVDAGRDCFKVQRDCAIATRHLLSAVIP